MAAPEQGHVFALARASPLRYSAAMRNPLALTAWVFGSAACAAAPPPSAVPAVHGAPAPSHASAPDAASDPCRAAVCPAGTRCELQPSPDYAEGNRVVSRPRCVPPAPAPAPSPTRDPCAAFICPAHYHCTAPADAPYCDRD